MKTQEKRYYWIFIIGAILTLILCQSCSSTKPLHITNPTAKEHKFITPEESHIINTRRFMLIKYRGCILPNQSSKTRLA